MAGNKLVVVKLGGSVITFKSRPLQANLDAIDGLAMALAKVGTPKIVVHGGGSFGHPYATKHGLSTQAKTVPPEAVAETHNAMLELNRLVVSSMARSQLHPYSLPPCAFMIQSGVTEGGKSLLQNLLNEQNTPVSFGDVMVQERGAYIISGDRIVLALAERFRPDRVVFIMNVDGIYRSMNSPDSLIEQLSIEDCPKISLSRPGVDVTGGVRGKLDEAFKIASLGVDVCFVNGFDLEMTFKALKGLKFRGTIIRGAMQ